MDIEKGKPLMSPKDMLDTSTKIHNNVLQIETISSIYLKKMYIEKDKPLMSSAGMLDTSIKIQNNVLQIDTDALKKNGQ